LLILILYLWWTLTLTPFSITWGFGFFLFYLSVKFFEIILGLQMTVFHICKSVLWQLRYACWHVILTICYRLVVRRKSSKWDTAIWHYMVGWLVELVAHRTQYAALLNLLYRHLTSILIMTRKYNSII